MADPDTLAQFAARALDNAERSGAKQTWIDLVDHGGGLEADSFGGIMPMQSIADAIARGGAVHAKAHPADANRNVDGVVANRCLMSTLGFARNAATGPYTNGSRHVRRITKQSIQPPLDLQQRNSVH